MPLMRNFQFAGVALVVMSASLAGCTIDELIPNPPGYDEPDWVTEYHNFTIETVENNTTVPIIVFGNESTWLEVFSVDMSIQELSYEEVDNELIFDNTTFNVNGYLNYSGFLWNVGFAPDVGNATLVIPIMVDKTYNCVIVYREWSGKE